MASKLQRLDELTGPPVVGKWYLVPHVKQWAKDIGPRIEWEVPIRHTAHRDPDLGVPVKHLHFDTRFLSRRLIKELSIRPEQLDTSVVPLEDGPSVYRITDGVVFYKRAMCSRLTTVWPRLHDYSPKWTKWAQGYRRKCLTKGHVCPHRGFDLSKVSPDANGVITCPLHGLQWCSKTGKNVPHPVVK